MAQSDPSSFSQWRPSCILALCTFYLHYEQRLDRYLEGMARVQLPSQPPWRSHEPSSSSSRMQLNPWELSRIWASFPTYSPTFARFLNGHPSLKPGRFPLIPFISSTRALYGHTPLPKSGHFLMISSTVKVKNMDTALVEVKMKLN